ncbi:hypothetical protein GX50_05618, partial [[Emmonsia] crescens]
MAPTTRSRAQSADVIGGFPVEPMDNQTTPPPTAVRMRAASAANNNDGSPTPVRGPAAVAAGGVESSNQNTTSNTTLNELQLKLQISRIECEKAEIERDNLRLRLELMKHPSNQPNQSNSNQSNPPASPVSHLHGRAPDYDPDSLIGKKIAAFLRTAKLVLKPINLNGSSNYLVWRESILFCVETVRCHLILNNEEEVSSFDEQQDTTFWTEQNEWLYFYIWNSLSPQALAYIEKP